MSDNAMERRPILGVVEDDITSTIDPDISLRLEKKDIKIE